MQKSVAMQTEENFQLFSVRFCNTLQNDSEPVYIRQGGARPALEKSHSDTACPLWLYRLRVLCEALWSIHKSVFSFDC